jgi:energy-coupling factor transporter ATP-binding protein EcfA2
MIRIRNLTYTYPESTHPALQDITLHIGEGDFVLLAGPTGSGKSTFLYCLMGLIPNVLAGEIRGHIEIAGVSPRALSVAEMSRIAGIVFQNPETQVFMLKVEDDVAFGCENLMMPKAEVMARREMALGDMGLVDVRHANTANLSAGMKQRLAISSVYAMGPRVLLFDEPTADLDAHGRQEFLEVATRLRERGHTIVVAEHRFEDLLPMADRVISFDKGRVGEGRPARPPRHLKSRQRIVGNATAAPITITGLSFRYNESKPLLEGINLEVGKGEVVALCGDNGSGKTTLLKMMAGILRPREGKIVVAGVENPSIEDIQGKVGFLFQNPDEQLFTNSVEDEIMFGPKQLGKRVDIEACLAAADLADARKRHPQTLSRGQRQLLALVSVLAMEPEVLVLDEPTTGLDDKSWHNLFRILRERSAKGLTVIFSTHHGEARAYADRQILLNMGRIRSHDLS